MSKHVYQILEVVWGKNEIIEAQSFGNVDEALAFKSHLEHEEEKLHMLGEKTTWSTYLVVVRW